MSAITAEIGGGGKGFGEVGNGGSGGGDGDGGGVGGAGGMGGEDGGGGQQPSTSPASSTKKPCDCAGSVT